MWGEGKTKRTASSLFKATGVKPVFPIEPQFCVPLPLHIMLGLTKDYLLMFRDEVNFTSFCLAFFFSELTIFILIILAEEVRHE